MSERECVMVARASRGVHTTLRCGNARVHACVRVSVAEAATARNESHIKEAMINAKL